MERIRKTWLIGGACICIILISLWMVMRPFGFLNPDDGYRYVVGVCQQNLQTDIQLAFKSDVEAAAAQRDDVNVLFYSAGGDLEKQMQQLRTLLEQRVDCIIVSAESPESLEPAMKEVLDGGVSLIVMGTNKSQVACDVLIRTDYFEIGKAAGTYFLQHSSPICFLEIQGNPRVQRIRELQMGFRSIIDDVPNILSPYVIVGYDSYMVTQQRIVQSGMIDAMPPITGVFAHSSEMALAAADIFKTYGEYPRILSVGGKTDGNSIAVGDSLEVVISVPSGGAEAFSFAEELMGGKTVPNEYTLPITLLNVKDSENSSACQEVLQ